jgi:uncharacterized membrane protein
VVGSGNGNGFLYSGGVYTDIIPPGWSGITVNDINNNGEVLGYGNYIIGTSRGFIYSQGLYTDIIPPGWSWAKVYDINNSGEVVGYGSGGTFLYSEGVYTGPIMLPPGVVTIRFNRINDSGVVVGDWLTVFGNRGFMCIDGQYTELLPPGWYEAFTSGINNNGEVLGNVDTIGTSRGFIYSQGVYTDIIPPGWSWAKVYDINNSGEVVGEGLDGTTKKLFMAIPIKTPLEQIQSIIAFFDSNVESGYLSGIGKTEQDAAGKLKAFGNMLLQAQYLIENEYIEACEQLMSAYKKIDGQPQPPDFIEGNAAEELTSKINALIQDLNCM